MLEGRSFPIPKHDRMQEHPGSAESHNIPHRVPLVRTEAVYRAPATSDPAPVVGAVVDARAGIIEESPAVLTEAVVSMLLPAVHTDHELGGPLAVLDAFFYALHETSFRAAKTFYQDMCQTEQISSCAPR